MKKLVIAVFLIAIAIAGLSTINSSHASSTATITVDSATQNFPSAQVGDTIQVNITISNVQELWAWDITNITFNPAVLSLTQVTEGPFLKQGGQTVFIWTSSSTLAISKGDIPDTSDTLLEATGVSGSGVLATLTFNVVSSGTSQIGFGQPTLLNPSQISTTENYVSMACSAINATVTVGPTQRSSTPTSSSAPGSSSTTSSSSNPSPTASPTSSSAPGSSSSSPSPTASPTSSSAPGSSSSSPSPTASPNSETIPEFPSLLIVLALVIAATASMLLLSKKVKTNKQ